MKKAVKTFDDVIVILNTYENDVIVPEIISDRTGYILGHVYRIVFNYRMALKKYPQMTKEEIMKLSTTRIKYIKDNDNK